LRNHEPGLHDGAADAPAFVAVVKEDLRERYGGGLAIGERGDGDGVFDGVAVAAAVQSEGVGR
jgi:hypothetical protein